MSAAPERPETAGEPELLAYEADIAVPANESDPAWDAVGRPPIPTPAREPAAVNGLAAAVGGAARARGGAVIETLRDATPPTPVATHAGPSANRPASANQGDRDWSPARLAARGRSAARPTRHAARRTRRPRRPRRLRAALALLVVLALAGTFFAWVTADPIWLAVGRGDTGTATVTGCVGSGLTQRCRGSFTEADGRFTTEVVRVVGASRTQTAPGTQVRAQMVHAGSGTAYLVDGTVLTLRWLLGILLVLLCGLGIVFATGALRLEDRRARRTAAVCGMAAPLLVTIGFLAAAY